MFLNSLGEGHQHPDECPVAAPCKSLFLLEAPSLFFFNLNGRKFPSKKLGYLHTWLRFLRIESRDSNFNIVSNPPVRIMREKKVSIKNSSAPPNPNIPCYRTEGRTPLAIKTKLKIFTRSIAT